MNKIPTAAELISKLIGLETVLRRASIYDEVIERMNIHAKNHSGAALKAAAKPFEKLHGTKQEILNAYPPSNIK